MEEQIKEVIKALEPIAAKLGEGAQTVFGWAIARNYAYVAVDVLAAICIMAVALIIRQAIQKYESTDNDAFPDQRDRETLSVRQCAWIPLVFGIAIAAFPLAFGLIRLVSPEISALGDILSVMK